MPATERSFHSGSGRLLKVTGSIVDAVVEIADREEKIDHVWITLDPGLGFLVQVSVNTLSLKNLNGGYDPRIRVGCVRTAVETFPPRGVVELAGFDYAGEESRHNIFYEHYDRRGMEELLLGKCREADLLEAWGVPYRRRIPGLHQIHSRRASCAVAEDRVGEDGGLRFYFHSQRSSLLMLFKFCGQP